MHALRNVLWVEFNNNRTHNPLGRDRSRNEDRVSKSLREYLKRKDLFSDEKVHTGLCFEERAI